MGSNNNGPLRNTQCWKLWSVLSLPLITEVASFCCVCCLVLQCCDSSGVPDREPATEAERQRRWAEMAEARKEEIKREKEAEERERQQQETEAAEKERIWKERLDMEAARTGGAGVASPSILRCL